MRPAPQGFGGDWTLEKLERLRKYLVAYTRIMSKRPFRFAYIDAFAGTGYFTLKESDGQPTFPKISDQDCRGFLDGSAKIALQVQPRFHKYIFIERDSARFRELEKLKSEFPALGDDIILEQEEANEYLQHLCLGRDWKSNRAVLFLDPFGMQVTWRTLEAIAYTQAIDVWVLFPLGVAVNRLLKRDGAINEACRERLDQMFGTEDWFESFYRTSTHIGLFGEQSVTRKTADFDSIARYFVDRLKAIFAGVADNPLPLFNSRGVPLYLLCFAAANRSGAPIAIKIAQDILGR